MACSIGQGLTILDRLDGGLSGVYSEYSKMDYRSLRRRLRAGQSKNGLALFIDDGPENSRLKEWLSITIRSV